LGKDPSHHLEANIRSIILPVLTLFGAVSVLVAHPVASSAQDSGAAEKWKASAEFSLTDQSGNSDLRLLTGGLRVSHLQQEIYELDASVTSRYGRSEGDLVALAHTGSLAFDLRPRETWSPFLFTTADRDEFKRLDLRLSTGAGARYTISRAPTGLREASLSLALLHSYERIAPAPPEAGAVPLGVETVHRARWSLRARGTHDVRDGVTLRHTTFYQPVWADVADYLLRSDTGVKILMTERLALSVDYQLKRDARPPVGVEPDDRLLKTGLIFDF
jgi:putative salt-induced outer membrane protein YdiY